MTEAQPPLSLNGFTLADLACYTHEGSFPANDSADFRVFYAGRDDLHGVLKYLLARCTRSLRFNMFGYDDDELDGIIRGLVAKDTVFVQGTLDKSQASGVHERAILQGWDQAMRNSFAIGQSATHQISHTKGGVIDGVVAWEGSTNWSNSGEGHGPKSQNNTLSVFVHPVQIARFSDELDYEHTVALRNQKSNS